MNTKDIIIDTIIKNRYKYSDAELKAILNKLVEISKKQNAVSQSLSDIDREQTVSDWLSIFSV
jgi:uncharacterized protein YejL (UPF0352 family)